MSHVRLQRAAFVVAKGAPLKVKQRPIPNPNDDQVLVHMKAVGVNAINAKQRDIGVYIQEYPTVIGNDGAGVIIKAGKNVSKFMVGDRIVFEGLGGKADEAAFQEYVLVSPDLAAKIPSFMTDEEAATLPTAFGTSFTALFGASGAGIKPPYSGRSVPPASSIVILGGSGSMGQMGIQFARLAGFDTIVTTASKVHEDYLKSLGATHVLDRHATADAKTILKIAPDVKLVYDTISKESTRALSVSILAKEGGKLIRTLPYEGADLPSDITVKYIVGIFHSNTNGEGPHFWNAAQKWLEDGVLKPNRTEVFEGIEKVDEALTRQARGVSGKKIVIKFLD